jgi:hypothetical protein
LDQDLTRTWNRVRHLGDLNPTWFGKSDGPHAGAFLIIG